MKNETTTIKIKATKSEADLWRRKANALGVPRADYLHSLLSSGDSFPNAVTTQKQFPRTIRG